MQAAPSPMADARNIRIEETLRDGTRLTIRAARPDDRDRIARAFHGLERDSVYTRFFTYKDALTSAELARLDAMDFVRDVMLLATVHADDDETVVGSAQYVSLEAKCAEVAFTVEEDFRGRGIAGRLLRQLIAIARASGIDRFEADVLPGNASMLAVLAGSGLPVKRRREGGVVHVTLALRAEA